MAHNNYYREQHILDTAEQAFTEYGFKETTIRLITYKAGINVAMLHYYFRSKDKLFQMVLERRIAEFTGRTQIAGNEDENRMEQLLKAIGLYTAIIMENQAFYKMILSEILVRNGEVPAQTIQNFFASNRNCLKKILLKGTREKFFRPVDVDLLLNMVFGTLVNILMWTNAETDDSDTVCKRIENYFREMFGWIVV